MITQAFIFKIASGSLATMLGWRWAVFDPFCLTTVGEQQSPTRYGAPLTPALYTPEKGVLRARMRDVGIGAKRIDELTVHYGVPPSQVGFLTALRSHRTSSAALLCG